MVEIIPGRKLKLSRYSGTNRCREGTLKSEVELRDRRELQGVVNNKGEHHGAEES